MQSVKQICTVCLQFFLMFITQGWIAVARLVMQDVEIMLPFCHPRLQSWQFNGIRGWGLRGSSPLLLELVSNSSPSRSIALEAIGSQSCLLYVRIVCVQCWLQSSFNVCKIRFASWGYFVIGDAVKSGVGNNIGYSLGERFAKALLVLNFLGCPDCLSTLGMGWSRSQVANSLLGVF